MTASYRCFPIHVLLFLLAFGSTYNAGAATLSGRITDSTGEGVAFVTVYVKGTSLGTTSNANGNYTLAMQPGDYEVIFRMIGYRTHTVSVKVGTEDLTRNIRLEAEEYETETVVVTAGTEDPAYRIIREAQRMRKFYNEQVEAFSCDVYIKGLEKLSNKPEKILGQTVNIPNYDSLTGIVYLSESVSQYNFKRPDKVREVMTSSKVSGDRNGFSYNTANDAYFNFYENVIEIEGLSDRGFISPIAASAMVYYKYKLVGDIFENEQLIHKIEVTPRRKIDPVFRGFIYIVNKSWRIYSTELMLTKDAQIDFVDSLVVNQVHVPIDDSVWMLFTNKFLYRWGAFGFKGNGYYVGIHSNYVLDPDFPRGFFGPEEWKVKDDANKKDSAYWVGTRPVPLTQEEEEDYRRRDSLMKIRNSQAYKDSVDRENNKFKFGELFTGYRYRNSTKGYSIGFPSLLSSLSYNTVQGLVIRPGLSYSRSNDDKNTYSSTSSSIEYGLANKRWYGALSRYHYYNAQKFANYRLRVAHEAAQFNHEEPIIPIINTSYTLLAEQNFMKLYEQSILSASHSSELRNGITLSANASYANRSPLQNAASFTIVDKPDKSYTSNNPQNEANDAPAFKPHQALILDLTLRLRVKQKYYTRPNMKVITGSKYPSFEINYRKGIPALGSDINYDYAEIGIKDDIKLGMAGTSKYHVSYGGFLNRDSMGFMDYTHFGGNQTILAFFPTKNFNLLPYYKYSTNGYNLQAHFEHRFGGLFLNKIPLIRKLKLSEVGGIHYLSSPTLSQYVELSAGVEKFGVIRVDFVTGFSSGKKTTAGFRIGLAFGRGNG